MNVRKIRKGKQMKKKINLLKRKTAILTIAGAMAKSGAAGMASVAKAVSSGAKTAGIVTLSGGNTDNEKLSFSNTNSKNGYCGFRRKYNQTKVYVFPTVGPKLKYTVQGADSASGANTTDRSNTHAIPLGVEASITNMVNENRNTYARLRMRRTISAQVDSIGWWSPDSTRNYTVYD